MNIRISSRESRTRLAELMRHLFSGCITNDEFEDAATDLIPFDLAVDQVYRLGAWPSYDDNRCYSLKGRDALTRENKRVVARWMLFLKTELPYQWGEFPKLQSKYLGLFCLLPIPLALFFWRWELIPLGFILTLALFSVADGIYQRMNRSTFEAMGDIHYWPFISKSDYELALASPPYLRGK